VLVLLFFKYVSDKYAGDPHALIHVPVAKAGKSGGSFADMVAAKGDKEIGDRLNKIIGRLADANDVLKGAINVADFNDEDKLGKGQEMVDRLTKLVSIFESLNFGNNRAEGDDLLGDAYEYLMRHFATESGKSKGQFYTPAEVSRIMAMVIDLGGATRADQSIYDPTCGSGSLLLKAHDEAKNRTGLDLALYGQEMDNATSALARMNMVLHDCPTAEVWQANTLAAPHFKSADGGLKTFDFVVANPPFSNKNWTSGLDAANDLFGRFELGTPPDKNGDYAFLLHMLKSLKSTGKAAVVLPHGVLFRGGAEGAIRKRIVSQGFVKGIIGLPANLFYGTGIPACLLILDKAGAAGRASGKSGLFMVDASKGFIKDGPKNRLRAQDIHRIVDTFTKQLEQPRYARMVPLAEIAGNDFNLNLPRYIDSSEPEDQQDIEAHLKGGIPKRDIDEGADLAPYWKLLPSMRAELFAPLDATQSKSKQSRPNYCRLKIDTGQIKSAIFDHPEFTAFNRQVTQLFAAWAAKNRPKLVGIQIGDRPKALIEQLSESLLDEFRASKAVASLIDPYGVYQHLMDYWVEMMQDDAYLIAADGWGKGAQPREIVKTNNKDNKLVWPEAHDFLLGKRRFKSDLIPKTVMVARYFAKEQAALDATQAELEAVVAKLTELEEEHSGEDAAFAGFEGVSTSAVKGRIAEIGKDPGGAEELVVLKQWLKLSDTAADLRKQWRELDAKLNERAFEKYAHLSEKEIKSLVVDDKWLNALAASVQGELDRVSQALTGRIKQLAERYATPLPVLAGEVETLGAKVDEHLRRMGFVCE
jgi:type I restriction enzyme M protein